jgi:hypothetical protein
MNSKAFVYGVVITAIAVLIGWYIYLQNMRYIVTGSQQGIAYQIDRKTGESWTIYPGRREKNRGPNLERIKKEYPLLPEEEQSKVDGNATLRSESFSGTLYNGSNWTIKEVIVRIIVKEKDGSTRWDRLFREAVTIPPLTTGDINFDIVGGQDFDSFEWGLKEIKGISPK